MSAAVNSSVEMFDDGAVAAEPTPKAAPKKRAAPKAKRKSPAPAAPPPVVVDGGFVTVTVSLVGEVVEAPKDMESLVDDMWLQGVAKNALERRIKGMREHFRRWTQETGERSYSTSLGHKAWVQSSSGRTIDLKALERDAASGDRKARACLKTLESYIKVWEGADTVRTNT